MRTNQGLTDLVHLLFRGYLGASMHRLWVSDRVSQYPLRYSLDSSGTRPTFLRLPKGSKWLTSSFSVRSSVSTWSGGTTRPSEWCSAISSLSIPLTPEAFEKYLDDNIWPHPCINHRIERSQWRPYVIINRVFIQLFAPWHEARTLDVVAVDDKHMHSVVTWSENNVDGGDNRTFAGW
jgi:hypothetical protein